MSNSQKEKEQEEKYYLASQGRLMWWKLKKHRLAMIAIPALGLLYSLVIFAEFISPYGPLTRFPRYLNAPPQRIRFFDKEGNFHLRPFVYGLERQRDPVTFRRTFTVDESRRYPIYFFTRGESYKFWGLFESNRRLFGTEGGQIFLFGTEGLGRCLFSRTVHGARISLSIGLVGVFLALGLGVILGSMAGYFGGLIDSIIMRAVDLLISIPTLPLWMALAAAVPREWPVYKTFFAITIVLSIVGWTGLARVIRGKFLALREEDFAMAAKVAGATDGRIIARHLLPSFSSFLIVHLTLAIPAMILGETALSFLGLGLQPPAVSWGVLLQDAQNVAAVAHHPWLLIPCLFVIVAVLMFNFLGDGLRDVADPYR